MKKQVILTNNNQETHKLAESLAKKCTGKEVFTLYGDLGAGKTAFCQGLATGLKVKNQVNSPTFNILKTYKASHGNIDTFCHIDAYRLNTGEDLVNLGVIDYLEDENTVTAIEWPEKVQSIIPAGNKKIFIKSISEEKREITLFF